MIRAILIIATSIAFSSCQTQTPIVKNAETRVGSYYNRGKSRQCANFVSDVLRKSGYNVQHSSAQSFSSFGRKSSSLKDGSIVLFAGTYNGPNYITHVGFYNNGYLIHRPTKSSPVEKVLFNEYWRNHLAQIRVP